jgi:hypothetical protein
MRQEPLTMLWAWETAEDLRGLDAGRVGVAFLAREVLVSDRVEVRARQQPLMVAPGTWLMAVVRVETAPRFVPGAATRADAVAQAIAVAADGPNVRAVQVDFDTTASQRDWYAAMLRELRQRLPVGMPLSITALVSWCGEHSWLSGLPSGALPVDEAVPMFFRMGGPAATRATRAKDAAAVSEPLCAGSAGVATDETWPAIHSGQRVYVFRSGSWTKEDLARIDRSGYEGLKEVHTP